MLETGKLVPPQLKPQILSSLPWQDPALQALGKWYLGGGLPSSAQAGPGCFAVYEGRFSDSSKDVKELAVLQVVR
jgi:hypothetical protein